MKIASTVHIYCRYFLGKYIINKNRASFFHGMSILLFFLNLAVLKTPSSSNKDDFCVVFIWLYNQFQEMNCLWGKEIKYFLSIYCLFVWYFTRHQQFFSYLTATVHNSVFLDYFLTRT